MIWKYILIAILTFDVTCITVMALLIDIDTSLFIIKWKKEHDSKK